MATSLILTATAASAAAGLATAVGALPVFGFGQERMMRMEKLFLGFAAGVMMAASFFSLIIPGIEAAEARGASRHSAAGVVVFAVLLGAGVLHLVHRYAPPIERILASPPGADAAQVQRIWLFVLAIALHNLPEGLAVGVSFGGGDMRGGTATAIGIGLQNIPEGLAVAVLVLSLGYRRRTAFLVALASGLVEPVMGFFGIALVSLSSVLLPWGLGLAAGAMLYVVSSEIIPETHRPERANRATAGLMVGLAAMMFLDVTLG